MALLEGIRRNRFVVFGRAGMDFFPDPPGTKTENATEMRVGLDVYCSLDEPEPLLKISGMNMKRAEIRVRLVDRIGRVPVNPVPGLASLTRTQRPGMLRKVRVQR